METGWGPEIRAGKLIQSVNANLQAAGVPPIKFVLILVNEQCFAYGERSTYAGFSAMGKAGFNAEHAPAYRNNTNAARDRVCAAARAANLRTRVLPGAPDGDFHYSFDH